MSCLQTFLSVIDNVNCNLDFLSRASSLGLVKIDSRGRVSQFSEKPKGMDKMAMVWWTASRTILLREFYIRSLDFLQHYHPKFFWYLLNYVVFWCTAASRHLYHRIVRGGGCKISVYRFYGSICIQDRRFIEASPVEIPDFKRLWVWDHTICSKGTKCAGSFPSLHLLMMFKTNNAQKIILFP